MALVLDPRMWPWAEFLRHPLFVALVQLVVGGVVAYVLTERWQRWRQRRDFQHRTLVKFGELSYEMMDLIAELLILRRSMEPQVYILKRRELLTRWTVFLSIRGEVMAAFGRAFILSGDYQGIFHALQTLRSYVGAKEPVAQERFEPEQEKFLAYRETVVSHMVRAMNLMSGKEWSVEVERARVRVQEADTAARALIEGSAAPPSGTPAA